MRSLSILFRVSSASLISAILYNVISPRSRTRKDAILERGGPQLITSALAKILPYNDSHQLKFVAVWSHRVRWNNPTTLSQLMRNSKLIVMMVLFGIEAKRDERQTFAASLRKYQKPEGLQICGQVIGGTSQIPTRVVSMK